MIMMMNLNGSLNVKKQGNKKLVNVVYFIKKNTRKLVFLFYKIEITQIIKLLNNQEIFVINIIKTLYLF